MMLEVERVIMFDQFSLGNSISVYCESNVTGGRIETHVLVECTNMTIWNASVLKQVTHCK